MTFGFQSAIDIATRTLDELHTTAKSHGRIMIAEIMGNKAGWLTLGRSIFLTSFQEGSSREFQ